MPIINTQPPLALSQVRDPKTYSSLKLKGREVFPAVFDEDVESLLQYRNSQKRTYSAVIKKADRIDMRTALARLREPGVPELVRLTFLRHSPPRLPPPCLDLARSSPNSHPLRSHTTIHLIQERTASPL